MHRLSIAILALLILTINAKSQQGCDLTLAQAPAFYHLHLGQDLDDVYKVLPGLRTDSNFQTLLSLAQEDSLPRQVMFSPNISTAGYTDPETARRISSLSLGFYDRKVIHLGFSYHWPIWDSASEFLARLREAIQLPEEGLWVISGKSMFCKCKEFQVNVGVGDRGGYLNFADLTAGSRMQAARQRILQKAKQDFHP